jgi:hypothetical protein
VLKQIFQVAERLPGWWRMRSLLLPHAAALNRKRLGNVTFVGITGSAGKTTARTLAMAVLSTAYKVRSTGSDNTFESVMRTVFATKPADDFCVMEFSAAPKGCLDRSLATVRPKIGVVTSIGTDHLKAYHSVEAIAAQKSKVIQCLPADGVAVLNADDPLVIAMADRSPCRVITYGAAGTAVVRAQNIRSDWPERLSFTVVYRGESVEVRSQLYGSHWISAILAAVGVGIAVGIPLTKAARAIESVEPYPGRMYPLTSSDGITFIVDDWKSGLWTMASVFDFMEAARADRKVLIIGTLSDYEGVRAHRGLCAGSGGSSHLCRPHGQPCAPRQGARERQQASCIWNHQSRFRFPGLPPSQRRSCRSEGCRRRRPFESPCTQLDRADLLLEHELPQDDAVQQLRRTESEGSSESDAAGCQLTSRNYASS